VRELSRQADRRALTTTPITEEIEMTYADPGQDPNAVPAEQPPAEPTTPDRDVERENDPWHGAGRPGEGGPTKRADEDEEPDAA
jgi:hypothetical protein